MDRPSQLCELIVSNKLHFFGSSSKLSSGKFVSNTKCGIIGFLVLGLVFCWLSTAEVTEIFLMLALAEEPQTYGIYM